MISKKSKLLTGGLLAGLVAGSGAGLVLQSSGLAGAAAPAVVAQADDTTTDSSTDSSTDSGTDSGTDSTDARPDRSARLAEVLQPLVDDGTLTAAQLDAVVAALDAAGPMGRGGHGDRDGGGRGFGRGAGIDAAAEALGLTADELRTELEAGSTLAEVATAQGVDAQAVIDALVLEAGTHLSEHVAAGDLTQEEADARLTEITASITDMVNNGTPMGRPGGMRGGHGRDGDAATDTTTDTDDITTDSASA